MIVLSGITIDAIPNEFSKAVDSHEKLIYWATDNLGLVHACETDLDWGNIILLFAARGKVLLMEKISNSLNRKVPLESCNKFQITTNNWSEFYSDFKDKIDDKVKMQFQYSIENRLQKTWDTRLIMNDINDFEYFRDERDTIQFFLLGYEGNNKEYFEDVVINKDVMIKNYINKELIPSFKKKDIYKFVQEGNVSWVPRDDFWWRHL
jgi:hypothetical protein